MKTRFVSRAFTLHVDARYVSWDLSFRGKRGGAAFAFRGVSFASRVNLAAHRCRERYARTEGGEEEENMKRQ